MASGSLKKHFQTRDVDCADWANVFPLPSFPCQSLGGKKQSIECSQSLMHSRESVSLAAIIAEHRQRQGNAVAQAQSLERHTILTIALPLLPLRIELVLGAVSSLKQIRARVVSWNRTSIAAGRWCHS